jgi:hypothetical protein
MSTAAETSFSCQNAAQRKEKETEKKMHLEEKQMLPKKEKKKCCVKKKKVLPNRKENTTPIVYLIGQVLGAQVWMQLKHYQVTNGLGYRS